MISATLINEKKLDNMGTPKRNLYVTNTNDKSKCIILSAYIPIKKEDGKYYMPDNTPLGYDMWIPNVLDLKEEEGTVRVEVIESKEETGLWLIQEDGYFLEEQWLQTDKPKYIEGRTDKFDFNEKHYEENVDFFNNLHIDTNIKMKNGDCIPVTLKRK